jgi:polyisoprenyl-teichoic acid--peptidoglycan teichoic acid transferase
MLDFFKTFFILLGIVVLILGGSYVYFEKFVWNQFYNEDLIQEDVAVAERQAELNRLLEEQNGYEEGRPLVFMIAGIDTMEGSVGRADSLLLAIIDKKKKTVDLLSLPRDLRVSIPNSGINKINAAYAIGKESLTRETISTYLDIPIDQYIVLNFKGFQQLIDTIGGLSIHVEKDIRFHDRISNKYVELSEGRQTLNGREALSYSRFRGDARGDFARAERQQQVIRELMSQTVTLGNIGKLPDIISTLGSNLRTDTSFEEATKLGISLAGIESSNIRSLNMNSYASTIGGTSYVVVNDAELFRVKNELQRILSRDE